MATLMGSLLRSASRKPNTKFNVISFPTHERFQIGLANTNCEFYLFQGEGIKTWDTVYGELPANTHLLDPRKGLSQLPIDIEFDMILTQNKFGQFPVAKQLSQMLHLPLISLEHTLPMENWSSKRIEYYKLLRGDINVFISEYSRDKWGWLPEEARVIHHGIDTDLFSHCIPTTKEPTVLSVVNDFVNRNWCCGYELWCETTKNLHKQRVILGKTPGLSEPAKSIDDLVQAYSDCRVFLNTSLVSPIPTVVLEAMSVGKPIVSTNNCMLPEIIEHGINGFLGANAQELEYYVRKLLDNEELAKKMGDAARKTIVDRFSMSNFVANWNRVFEKATEISYKGAIA